MTTINFGTIKQASEPTITFTWPLPSAHAPTNWTGATITGTMRHIRTEAVTAITGALVVVTGTTRVCTWAMSPDDTGTDGVYQVTLLADVAGTPIYTLYGFLTIEENPAVTAVAGPGLVGILAATSTWLTDEKAATEATTDGNLLQSDGDNSEDSGIAAADVALTTGATFSGTLAMADQLLTRPLLRDYGESVNAIGSIGGGTQDIDLESGNVVSGTVDTAETTFTFSNPPASGRAGSFTLILTNGGSQTVNWPASVDWAGGTAPTLTAAGVDILTFVTIDGGTIWYGFAAGLEMS